LTLIEYLFLRFAVVKTYFIHLFNQIINLFAVMWLLLFYLFNFLLYLNNRLSLFLFCNCINFS